MKITGVAVQNLLGLSLVKLEPKKPVIIIAGNNGAGKTSLYQGIKLALLDELPRVDLKKDAGEIVRAGAGKGSVAVATDTGYNAIVSLPSRDRNVPPFNGLTAFCLEPSLFTHMDAPERMKLVLQLSKVRMDKATIASKLAAREIPKEIVDELEPLLILGFEKCAEYSKTQAAEHRGAWKQITGETYGPVKAKSWQVPAADALPEAPADLTTAVKDHSEATARLAQLQSDRTTFDQAQERATKDTDLAAGVEAATAKVAELRPAAEADEEKVHLSCPECGTVLDLTANGDGAGALVKAVIDATKKTVKPAALARAKAAYGAAQRELSTAQAAVARLAEPFRLAERPSDEEIAAAQDKVAVATDLLSSITTAQQAYAAAAQAQTDAKKRQESADKQYRLVEGWETAREALSPGGIPSELMMQAMAPMRAAINGICASAHVRNWPLPSIADNGAITSWGRPYQLLSESEQYRVDAIFAAAIADLSGLKILACDRADVLSPSTRGEFLSWLVDMTDDGAIDQAWMFATLKSAPKFDEDSPIEAHWVENGALSG